MKYGIDMGHNCPPDIGAVSIGKEDNLNREVGLKVIEKLRALGHEVVDCTPKKAISVTDSLSQRVFIANVQKVDIYVAIHFNAGGGTGSEVFAVSDQGKKLGNNILEQTSILGYINRGVKDGSKLYVVRRTNMDSILVECCFVDSKDDMQRYNGEYMANAIVKGLTGSLPDKVKKEDGRKELLKDNSSKNQINISALEIQKALNTLKIGDSDGKLLVEDGLLGTKTQVCITKFQYVIKIKPTGVMDEGTWEAVKKIFVKPLLKIGTDQYIETRYLQWRLNVFIDGIFGNVTRVAVMKLQQDNKLAVDGVVGEKTWKALRIGG